MTIIHHAGIWHLLNNAIALLILAPRAIRALGWVQSALVATIAGELANQLTIIMIDRPVIGASSVVFALLGARWTLFPRDRAERLGIGILVAAQLVFCAIALDFGGIAWTAHVLGALFGAAGVFVLQWTRRKSRLATQ